MHNIYEVLVVEDSPADAAVYKSYLNRSTLNTFNLHTAVTGHEGIGLLQEREFSCVILDQNLPDMDAQEFVQLCDAEHNETPIVIITGYADPKLDQEMLQLGIADYLDKGGLRPEALERALLHAMERHALIQQLHLANQAKEKFLLEMSRDLKRPLETLFEYCDNFFENKQLYGSPQHLLDIVQYIYGCTKKQKQVMDRMIARSIIDDERKGITLSHVSLNESLAGVVERYRVKALEKGLAFVADFPEDGTAVDVDEYKLVTAYACLLDNAVKFTEQGRIYTAVSVDQAGINIKVTDTGIGIPSRSRTKIFSAYTHGSRNVAQKYGGLGNGLAIAKELVHLQGGDLQLIKSAASGSSFEVTIPVNSKRECHAPTSHLKPLAVS